jgi:hypothetical protein
MIGVGVGIDGVKQFRGKKFSELDVLFGFVELRIDNDALLFLGTAKEIRQAAARTNLLENNISRGHRTTQ